MLICFALNLVFSLLMHHASAEGHRPVRLDAPGFSMEHVEVHNQQQVGDCYAHAAAQLYDAWRFKLGDEDYSKQSSGFEINQRWKIYRDDDSIDGGKLEEVAPLLSVQGTCAQSDLNRMFKGTDVDGYASEVLKIYHDQAMAFHSLVDPMIAKFPKFSDPMIQYYWDQQAKEVEDRYRPQFLKKGVELLQNYHRRVLTFTYNDQRFKWLKADKDVVEVFKVIGIIKCGDDQKLHAAKPFAVKKQDHTSWVQWHRLPGLILPLPTVRHQFEPQSALERIHAELDYHKEAMPIGIGYCSKVLKAGRAFKTVMPNAKDDACGRHASLIIGRRPAQKPGGHPQLLIRNTWGSWSCGSYSKDWDCENSKPDVDPVTHERHTANMKGSVWIDEDILSKAIFETEVFVRD